MSDDRRYEADAYGRGRGMRLNAAGASNDPTMALRILAVALLAFVSSGACAASTTTPAPAPTIDGGICTTNGLAFPQEPGNCAGVTCAAGCECGDIGDGEPCVCNRAVPPDAGTFCVPTNCGNIQCDEGCECSYPDGGYCDCPG